MVLVQLLHQAEGTTELLQPVFCHHPEAAKRVLTPWW